MIDISKFFDKVYEHRKKCEECLELYAALIEYLTNAEISLSQNKIENFTKYLDEVDKQINFMYNRGCIYPDTMRTVHKKTNLLRDFVKIKLHRDTIYQHFLHVKYICMSQLIGVIPDLCRQMIKCL